jgi:aerobic-type carbon monoxide dehydrogenase small subunit (CoxS/CutS family)
MEETTKFKVNGKTVAATGGGERKLLWFLRTDLGLTGAKYGCGQGYCGSCTVLVDGEPVRSCRTTIESVAGREVVTIEGLAANGKLHPLQKAFMEHDALQCGYCTPGMILQAAGLLSEKPRPGEADIVDFMNRSLCRCGAHTRIVKAIQTAALEMSGAGDR